MTILPALLTWTALSVVGLVACAEFGSYAFVHPVIRRLPAREQLLVEKGLLDTFGRVMPIGMTLAPLLTGACAALGRGLPAALAGAAAITTLVALVTTIAVNVGINRATRHWNPQDPPVNWLSTRRRWDTFQGIRSWLLLAGFLLLAASVAV